jgi:hypothetical protein
MMATEKSSVPAKRAQSRTRLGAVTWTPTAELPYPDWVAAGRRIGAMARASNWWIGDWVRYGNERWGEKYLAASRMTGYDVHTLRNMAYVASRFDLSLRRDNLTWSHHALLAALGAQEQGHWLDKATAEHMSVADLRTELRSSQRGALRCGDQAAEQAAHELERASPRDGRAPGAGRGPDGGDEPEAVCPQCGHELPPRKTDWNSFVGAVVRRRYGLGTGRRRAA